MTVYILYVISDWHVVRQMSQVYVTGLACGASDVTGLCHRFGMWCVRCYRFMSQVYVTGLCHRFGMWCVRCHRFMSQVWHVVRQMLQVYVTGLCHRFMSQVWHVVRQMSQVYVTGLACGASDVTGLACVMASVRLMSWRPCVRCHVT